MKQKSLKIYSTPISLVKETFVRRKKHTQEEAW